MRPQNAVFSLLLAAAVQLLSNSSGFTQHAIDDFTVAQGPLSAKYEKNPPPLSVGSTMPGEMTGEERDVKVSLLNIPQHGAGVTVEVGGGVLRFQQDASAIGQAIISWDGADGSADTLRTTGLGGVDLTANGDHDFFSICVLANETPVQISLIVTTDVNNISEKTIILPGSITEKTTFPLAFSDFLTSAGDGADFSNVGSVALFIGSGGGVSGSADLQLGPLALGMNYISRLDAIDIVRETFIDSSPYKDTLLAYLYKSTGLDSLLKAGDVVAPFEPTFEHLVENPCYFFWIDNGPEKEWLHDTNFLFVDAMSGDLSVYDANSWPMVNGEEVTEFTEGGEEAPDPVHGQTGALAPRYTYSPVETENTSDWAVLVVSRNAHGARERRARVNDIARITEIMNGVERGPKITADNIIVVPGADTLGATEEQVCAALEDSLGEEACETLYFFYLGHGTQRQGGRMLLRGNDEMSYRELGRKLIDTGAKEVGVIIEACYSGEALKDLQKLRRNRKRLRGFAVSSSPDDQTTTRIGSGAPFYIGLNACYKDAESDLDNSGDTHILEAIAWAAATNEQVADDEPQGVILGDRRRDDVTFLPSSSRQRLNNLHFGLSAEIVTVKYEIEKRGRGADEAVMRSTLYFENEGRRPVEGLDVDVWCNNRRGRKDEDEFVGSFSISLDRGRRDIDPRVCIADLPEDCNPEYGLTIEPASNVQHILARQNANATHTRGTRASAYDRGEPIFESIVLAGDGGQVHTASLTGNEGWQLSIEPSQFTSPTVIDSNFVSVHGVMPDTASHGGRVEVTLVNQATMDTTVVETHTLLSDSLDVNITDGSSFYYQEIDLRGDVTATTGTVSLEHSMLTFRQEGAVRVGENASLKLLNSTIRVDSAASYTMEVSGALDWQKSTLLNPADGLKLNAAMGSIYSGGVLASEGDGLALTGDLAQLSLNFFLITESAANGIVLDDAHGGMLRNIRVDNSGENDVMVSNGSEVTLLDCSYGVDKAQVDDTSVLTRAWTTQFVLTDLSGTVLSDILVEVIDASGNLVGTDTTDADGFMGPLQLIEYVQSGENRSFETPHEVRVHLSKAVVSLSYQAQSQAVKRLVVDQTTSATTDPELPSRFALSQNYPNPFNPATTVAFDLPEDSHVVIKIFNILGTEIRTVVAAPYQAGRHRVAWDGRNGIGAPVASGVYLYRIDAGSFTHVKKMMLLR